MLKRLGCLLAMVLTGVVYSATAQSVSTSVPLRNQRATVIHMYEVLSDVPADEARAIYQSLHVDLRSDLWTYQLEQFLASNPQLTPEQDVIAMEAVGILASGSFQREVQDVERAAHVRDRIADLAARAALVFTPRERLVFGDLGRHTLPDATASADVTERSPTVPPTARLQINGSRPRLIATNADCECNTVHDFCSNGPTAPIETCQRRAVPRRVRERLAAVVGSGCTVVTAFVFSGDAASGVQRRRVAAVLSLHARFAIFAR